VITRCLVAKRALRIVLALTPLPVTIILRIISYSSLLLRITQPAAVTASIPAIVQVGVHTVQQIMR
jgi:hypothetical protein